MGAFVIDEYITCNIELAELGESLYKNDFNIKMTNNIRIYLNFDENSV